MTVKDRVLRRLVQEHMPREPCKVGSLTTFIFSHREMAGEMTIAIESVEDVSLVLGAYLHCCTCTSIGILQWELRVCTHAGIKQDTAYSSQV